MQLPVLNPLKPDQSFPDIETALSYPDGLLAVGGCLSSQRIMNAYRQGIFPWYSSGEPILWWSPNPRLVLFPDNLNISRSLRKTLRKANFTTTYDQAFAQVMRYCAEPREKEKTTWISDDIYQAYVRLHQQGIAHSYEVWMEDELVGGLYGIAIGQVFFGESMFHKRTNASKIAFCSLIHQLSEWHYQLIDCQVHTDHLCSLGAEEIERETFAHLLKQYCPIPPNNQAWKQR